MHTITHIEKYEAPPVGQFRMLSFITARGEGYFYGYSGERNLKNSIEGMAEITLLRTPIEVETKVYLWADHNRLLFTSEDRAMRISVKHVGYVPPKTDNNRI